jgi:hypothetical protein
VGRLPLDNSGGPQLKRYSEVPQRLNYREQYFLSKWFMPSLVAIFAFRLETPLLPSPSASSRRWFTYRSTTTYLLKFWLLQMFMQPYLFPI